MQLLFIFCILFVRVSSDIIIGGIFDSKDKGSNDEKIFRHIIDELNQLNDKDGDKLIAKAVTISSGKPFQALLKTCSLLEKGALAIYGPSDPENFNAIASICDEKEIPVMQTRWNYNPTRDSFIINNYPHPTTLSKAYLDIIRAWKWNTFVILYDNDESLLRLTDVFKLSQNSNYLVISRQLDPQNTGSYRNTLKEILEFEITNIIIDCRIEQLSDVLTHAQQVGLMNKNYNFIITNIDMQTIDLISFQYSQANITGVRLISMEDDRIKKLSNVICNGRQKIHCVTETSAALIADSMMTLSAALQELKDSYNFATENLGISCNTSRSWEYGSSLANFMKTIKYYGYTGLHKFDNEGFRSNFALEIVELKENGLTPVGIWNSTEGFLNISREYETIYEDPDSDILFNKTLIVETCLTEPYAYLKESQNLLQGNERFEGFAIDLIEELAKIEKFNYIFTIREDKANGNLNNKTGQWSGMIGDLINKTADLAIADLTINWERAEAVDFTAPFMNLGISILFRQSEEAPPNFFSFAEPFAIDTWIALLFAFIIVSLSLYIMARLSAAEWTNPYPCIENPEFLVNQFSLQNSFWFSTGSLMQQGTEIAPIAISTRMVAGMWWFFILIMVASYTANLAAFLATQNPLRLFEDVASLVANAEEKNIRYGAKAKGATEKFFKDSENPIFQRVYEHMRDNPNDMVQENMDGVALAENEYYAFFMEDLSIEYFTQRHCTLEMYGGLLDHKGYGIAMRKNSPYRDRLSAAVLKLQSAGTIAELKRRWWNERRGGGQCAPDEESAEAMALNISNVEGVFYVTILGIIGGVLLVILEKIAEIVNITRKMKKPFCQVFKQELKFYLNFESNVKPNAINFGESEEESSKFNKLINNNIKP